MPSPFPGMDPWLEDEEVFPDLHESLCLYLREAMNAAMPPGYVATLKNRVWIDDELRREPDVSVFGRDRDPNGGGTALLAIPGVTPVELEERLSDPWQESYLEIVSPRGKRLVTAIEVLSLSNKQANSDGQKAYLEKHEEYFLGGVHIVEIDLLRGGTHTTNVPREALEALTPGFSYHVCISVAGPRRRRPQRHVAALRLADRLPAIGIPLDPDVPPVVVDLQPLLDRAYDTGRYSQLVDYARPCHPPLTADQQQWAEDILTAKALLS